MSQFIKFKNIYENILNCFFPKFCLGCGKEGDFICSKCFRKIKQEELVCPVCNKVNFVGQFCKAHKVGFYFSGLIFVCSFDQLPKQIIHTFKYEGIKELVKPIAKLMAKTLAENFRDHNDLILMPVPLFFIKRLNRGFNQSEILAQEIGKILNLKSENLILRQKSTKTQTELSAEMRKQNMCDAFALTNLGKEINLKNKTIIIVDDVYTTGSTINSVARIIKKKRPNGIWALTFCKD